MGRHRRCGCGGRRWFFCSFNGEWAIMSFVIEDVLVRYDPVGYRLPVVFDSPHSGTNYPSDFDFSCPANLLRQAEDAYVDELFAVAPEAGATLLCALFPRSYIDANRAIDDIDPTILDGDWRSRARPGDKSAFGIGLIRILCRPGVPIYDGPLAVHDVATRIDRYYRPYHFQLSSIVDGLVDEFGCVWHLNCHSMPSGPALTGAESTRPSLPDFVLGDRDGTTCETGFMRFVQHCLEGMGYRVGINVPYPGVELIRRHGNPRRGRHSLQIEINRRLYMDEDSLEKHAGFDALCCNLNRLIRHICDYAATRVLTHAAE